MTSIKATIESMKTRILFLETEYLNNLLPSGKSRYEIKSYLTLEISFRYLEVQYLVQTHIRFPKFLLQLSRLCILRIFCSVLHRDSNRKTFLGSSKGQPMGIYQFCLFGGVRAFERVADHPRF